MKIEKWANTGEQKISDMKLVMIANPGLLVGVSKFASARGPEQKDLASLVLGPWALELTMRALFVQYRLLEKKEEWPAIKRLPQLSNV